MLALQGDVSEHTRVLAGLGAEPVHVRTPADVAVCDVLVIPGGESTTMSRLAERAGLFEALTGRIAAGMPVLGTCAGAILLGRAARLHDGTATEQRVLEAVDAVARRNAFGRQVASFETDLPVAGVDYAPMHAVFIRAPWFEDLGARVEVLASTATSEGEKAVVVQQGRVLAAAFHPELVGDDRLHRRLLTLPRDRDGAVPDTPDEATDGPRDRAPSA